MRIMFLILLALTMTPVHAEDTYLSAEYLVFPASFTASDFNSISIELVGETKEYKQPIQRVSIFYNMDRTRAKVKIASDLESNPSIIQAVENGKAIKTGEYWIRTDRNGTYLDYVPLTNYRFDSTNPEWSFRINIFE